MPEDRTKRTILIAVLLLLVVFGLLQLIPQFREQENPPVVREPDWDSQETRQLAVRACYDCHSNETNWPWYSKIFPASVLMRRDVYDGREALNFSEWRTDDRPGEDVQRMAETIALDEMPPTRYLLLNPQARLNEEEKAELVEGLARTIEGEESAE